MVSIAIQRSLGRSLSRHELFAAMFILGCVNGLAASVIHSINGLGWIDAVLGTFGVSAFVWFACFVGISLIASEEGGKIALSDLWVGVVFLLLVAIPMKATSWLAVSALSLYVIYVSKKESDVRRGAVILFATTIPVLWSRLLFQLFTNVILNFDASLVSWLLGTPRNGNMVRFAHGTDYLVILPGCSSLANTSLAFLCWVTISQLVKHRWSWKDPVWCALACVSMIAINTGRISLMGLSIEYFDVVHSSFGEQVTNAITLCVAIGFSLLGVRRELFTRV